MKNLIIFLAGLGVGSGVTWYFVKEYYRRLADEEIESVVSRERFKDEDQREEKNEEPYKKEESAFDKKVYTDLIKNYTKPDIIDYAAKYHTNETAEEIDYSVTEHPEDDDEPSSEPYIISEEEFAGYTSDIEYDKITLTYYADDYLVEGEGVNSIVIENPNEVVGLDNLDESNFSEYGEDVIYVRNEKFGTDYEIIRSELNYME